MGDIGFGRAIITKEKGFIIRRGQYDYGYCLLPSVVLENLNTETLTKAELDTRRQAHAYVEAFRRYMPGMENCSMTGTGPTIGIRESRKIEGRYTLSEKDVVDAVKRSDGVARGGWKPEIHRDPNKMGEYIPVEDGSYYDIPLSALQSKSYSNLYGAGRIVSSDEIAFASARVMGTCFATGQAAGVAAAMQVRYGEVKIDVIRKELLRQGAII